MSEVIKIQISHMGDRSEFVKTLVNVGYKVWLEQYPGHKFNANSVVCFEYVEKEYVKHPTTVQGKNMETTACEIANLRYDAMGTLVRELSEQIHEDATVDREHGKPKLAGLMKEASAYLAAAAKTIEQAWEMSSPHMKEE